MFERLDKFLVKPQPKVKNLIANGILYPRSRFIIFGRAGSWKSMLAMHAGICLAQGDKWLRLDTAKSRVALAQIEIPEFQYQQRLKKYFKGKNADIDLYVASTPSLKIDDINHYKALDLYLEKIEPEILIIDPLYKTITKAGDNDAIEKWQYNVDLLASKYNCAVILVAHTKKFVHEGNAYDYGQELYGGSYWDNWVDSALYIKPTSFNRQATEFELHFTKNRLATVELEPMTIRWDRSTLKPTIQNVLLEIPTTRPESIDE